MAINAYEKFKDCIAENIGSNIVFSRIVKDEVELIEMLKMVKGSGFSLDMIKNLYRLGKVIGVETIYDNGLIKLETQVAYKKREVNSKEEKVNQLSIFSSYDETPLVNMVVKSDAKAFEQLLISGDSRDDLFREKDVFVREVSIDLKDTACGSSFKSYRRRDDASLILEKYRQVYPLSKYRFNSNDLFSLCGCNKRDLDIIYKNNQPIYAQFSDECSVEAANFNPNSKIDAKCIVDKVNEEVDAICDAIKNNLAEFTKKKKGKARTKITKSGKKS